MSRIPFHSFRSKKQLTLSIIFTGRYEDTLLHAVAERGHSSIFKLILNEVLNKNPKGHFADTPLHFAAEKGHIGKGSFNNYVNKKRGWRREGQ